MNKFRGCLSAIWVIGLIGTFIILAFIILWIIDFIYKLIVKWFY